MEDGVAELHPSPHFKVSEFPAALLLQEMQAALQVGWILESVCL